MSRWAPALVTAALVLAAGCGFDDTDPAANPARDAGVSNRLQRPGPQTGAAPPGRPDPRCGHVDDLAVAHPTAQRRAPSVEVAPDCSAIDATPFDAPRWPGPGVTSA